MHRIEFIVQRAFCSSAVGSARDSWPGKSICSMRLWRFCRNSRAHAFGAPLYAFCYA